MNSRADLSRPTLLNKVLLSVFCVLLMSAAPAMAQTATSGTVVGVVTDASGAVVPNADVQLVNLETNTAFSQKTNGSGQYTFPNLAPGNYKITVKMSGFRSASVSSITVEVNKSYNQPIALEVGTDNQVVEVTAAAAAQLQTT